MAFRYFKYNDDLILRAFMSKDNIIWFSLDDISSIFNCSFSSFDYEDFTDSICKLNSIVDKKDLKIRLTSVPIGNSLPILEDSLFINILGFIEYIKQIGTIKTDSKEIVWLFQTVIPSLYNDIINEKSNNLKTFSQDKITILGTDITSNTVQSVYSNNQKAFAYKKLKSLYDLAKNIDFEQFYPIIIAILQNYNEIFDETNTIDMVKEWKKLCLINKFKEDLKNLDSSVDFLEIK